VGGVRLSARDGGGVIVAKRNARIETN